MKKSKKKAGKKAGLLGGATKPLKKLGKLSTTQKVIAGAALAGVGLGLLSKQLAKRKAAAATDAPLASDAAEAQQTLDTLE